MTRYRLKKELPGFKVGRQFAVNTKSMPTVLDSGTGVQLFLNNEGLEEMNPEWFEKS